MKFFLRANIFPLCAFLVLILLSSFFPSISHGQGYGSGCPDPMVYTSSGGCACPADPTISRGVCQHTQTTCNPPYKIVNGTCIIPSDQTCPAHTKFQASTNTCDTIWIDCYPPGGGDGYERVSEAQGCSPGYAPLSASGRGNDVVYTPLEPLPGIPAAYENGSPANFPLLINFAYKLLLGLAAVLAVGSIVTYGIMYMVSEVTNQKAKARKRLQGAVFGLLLLLCAWIILNTINPQLLKFDIFLPPTKISTPIGLPSSVHADPNAAKKILCANQAGFFELCANGTDNDAIKGCQNANILFGGSSGGGTPVTGYLCSINESGAEFSADKAACQTTLHGDVVNKTPDWASNFKEAWLADPAYRTCNLWLVGNSEFLVNKDGKDVKYRGCAYIPNPAQVAIGNNDAPLVACLYNQE